MAEKTQDDIEIQDELKSRHKTRLEFWKKLLDKINKTENKSFQNINPSKDSWISSGVGMSGVGLNFVISRSYARTELYMSRSIKEENKFIFDELVKFKNEIEKEFGENLEWERLDNKKASRIKHEKTGVSLYEKDDWDTMMNFMIDSMIRMDKAFKKRLKSINQKLKNDIND